MARKKPSLNTKSRAKGKKMSNTNELGTIDNPKVEAAKVTQPSEKILGKKENQGILEIRGDHGSAGKLEIYFRHLVLADIVEKMAMSNYPRDNFDPVYKPILMDHPDPKAKAANRVVTRALIYAATKNFEAAEDFSFSSTPRGILIANPEALRAGYSLMVELKAPVPYDTLRKWGKQLIEGCSDIITASRPFRINWTMTESTPSKL